MLYTYYKTAHCIRSYKYHDICYETIKYYKAPYHKITCYKIQKERRLEALPFWEHPALLVIMKLNLA